jgi:hypothetical protein
MPAEAVQQSSLFSSSHCLIVANVSKRKRAEYRPVLYCKKVMTIRLICSSVLVF